MNFIFSKIFTFLLAYFISMGFSWGQNAGMGGMGMGMGMGMLDGCVMPDMPTIPDGSTATEEELIAAVNEVRNFQELNAVFRECLDTQERAFGEEIPDNALRRILGQYNQSVENEETLGSQVNDAIRVFRSR